MKLTSIDNPPIEVTWALHDRMRGEVRHVPGWTIQKIRPRVEVWAHSQHGAAKITHRVAFQVRATRLTSLGDYPPIYPSLTFTKWVCGISSVDWRGIKVVPKPDLPSGRCYGCSRPDQAPR